MTAAVDSDLYRVPKERAWVEIKMPPLRPERTEIFLSGSAENHQGSETVSDLLNADRLFLPLLDVTGGLTLIRREAIHWVRLEEPERVEWHYFENRRGLPRARIRCRFSDGSDLEGTVHVAGRSGEQRVQDLVNRGEDFVHLDTDTGLYLVNLGQIVRVAVVGEDGGP